MANSYRIEKVDPSIYTKKDWRRYFDFRLKSYALVNEPMPFNSIEELKALNTKNSEKGWVQYMVWKSEQENGMVCFAMGYKDDLQKRFTYLLNHMNDKYLEPELLEILFQQYLDYDSKSNSLNILSKDGENDYIVDNFGAYLKTKTDFYELNVKEVDLEKIDFWQSDAVAKFPLFRMEFYSEIPGDILEEYTRVYSQISNSISFTTESDDGELTANEWKESQEALKLRKKCLYTYLVFNESNAQIAQTNVLVNLNDTKKMDQWMTGVVKEHRGRGLGKWMKAAMFKKLLLDYPDLEKIETDVHPNNHPSIELNKRMGYKRTVSQKDFMIDRQYIVQYLNREM